MFYDRVEGGSIAELLHSVDGRLVREVLLDPSYPNPFAGSAVDATPPPSIVRFAPDVTIPSIVQYGLGLERQVGKSTTVVISYVRARGHHLFRSRDVNGDAFFALMGLLRVVGHPADLICTSTKSGVRPQ